MGKDCERICGGVSQLKEIISTQIESLSRACAYRIEVENHAYEKEKPAPAASYVQPIISAAAAVKGDIGSLKSLEGKMFTGVKNFHNSYGSPWTEFYRLEDKLNDLENYASSFSELKWLGEKVGLLGLLNQVLSHTVDAKWAINHYHDWVQRGYDAELNGNVPSIKFEGSLHGKSVGNLKQDYSENVNIPNEPIEVF